MPLKCLPGIVLLVLLAGCAATGDRQICAKDLSFVKEKLVTPYPKLEAFIGKEALEATLHKSIDDMITRGGGIEPSIRGGEDTVAGYQEILDHADETRAEYRKAGMTKDWIETYLLSVEDGVTINRAFVDAVKCRQAGLREQSGATPAG
jgi:hypothetical protein